MFLLSGLFLELGAVSPDLVVVIRREFEFIAVFGIVLLASADLIVALTVALTMCGLLTILFLVFGSTDFGVLELSWITLMSGYMVVYVCLILIARRRIDQAHSRSEMSAAIGSSIAHELRTPLLSIKTRAQALDKFVPRLVKENEASGGSLGARKLDLLEKATSSIIEEADSAATLIDIFLVNASNAKNNVPKSEDFDAHEAISEAIERFPYRSSREREAVEFHPNTNISIRGPRLLFVHIFFNLIKNSFEQLGAIHDPKISISIYDSAAEIEIHFKDNGPGIAPKDIKKIFKPFYSGSPQYGTGVGLTYCKATIENHFKGNISCESKVGAYTNMILKLPKGKHRVNIHRDQNRHP